MTLQFLQTVNFGRSRANATGSLGVGYTIYDVSGTVVTPRTVLGVYQLFSGSGNYAANISYPSNFNGSVLWDTGIAFLTASYASEQFNFEANNPSVDTVLQTVQTITGSIQTMLDMTEGRWKIVSNTMQFFKSDNTTLVATYNLFDDTGSPTMDAVFERVKVP